MAASNCIGITLGDPAGIGPEIVQAALASGKLDAAFTYRVVGERGNAIAGEPTPDTARICTSPSDTELESPALRGIGLTAGTSGLAENLRAIA